MEQQSSAPDVDSHQGTVPRHLAIIMDGNNRWARAQGLPGADGHRAGEDALQAIVRACGERGISVLTVFAFSSENWRRPDDEVRHLMALFLQALAKRVPELDDNGIRLRFIGDLSAFSDELRDGMATAMQATAGNRTMTLQVAVNYGGQWDIAAAARQLAEEAVAGQRSVDSIDANLLGQRVAGADLPLPDLLIRTGGEQRISNFMLWQCAYSEFWFSPVLWPDFDERCLDQALADYAGRQRRFGRSGDQVSARESNQC